MSTATEVILSLHPTGSFKARPETIGITAEEADALNRGALPPERAQSIGHAMTAAAVSLSTAPVMGHC